MNDEQQAHLCVACDRGSDTVPLIMLEFHGGRFWICPQHLPILIHQPERLAGRLSGAEGLEPSEHRD